MIIPFELIPIACYALLPAFFPLFKCSLELIWCVMSFSYGSSGFSWAFGTLRKWRSFKVLMSDLESTTDVEEPLFRF